MEREESKGRSFGAMALVCVFLSVLWRVECSVASVYVCGCVVVGAT